MSESRLQVIYSGESVESGSMDVRELAPALLSIGDLCQETNRLLNRDRAQVSVKVRSDFQRGSFEITLEVIQTLAAQAKAFLLGDEVRAAQTLTAILFGGGSLFGLYKFLKGRRPTATTTLENGNIQIQINAEHVEVKQEVAAIYQISSIRRASFGVVRPLEKVGIDRLDVRQEKNPVETVSREDLPSFLVDEPIEDMLHDQERTAVFEIVKLSFDEKYMWTLTDGSSNFNSDIEDEDFFAKVQQRQVTFGKGDILKVRIHSQTKRIDGKLKTTHKVVRVLEVIPGSEQLPLPPSE